MGGARWRRVFDHRRRVGCDLQRPLHQRQVVLLQSQRPPPIEREFRFPGGLPHPLEGMPLAIDPQARVADTALHLGQDRRTGRQHDAVDLVTSRIEQTRRHTRVARRVDPDVVGRRDRRLGSRETEQGGIAEPVGPIASGGEKADYQQQTERSPKTIAVDPGPTGARRGQAQTRDLGSQAAAMGFPQSSRFRVVVRRQIVVQTRQRPMLQTAVTLQPA